MFKIERGTGSPDIGRNSFNTLITQVIYFILTFITGIIIARAVGPSGKGIYTLVILLVSFGTIFTNLGLPTANSYFAGKRQDKIPALISNSFFSLTISIIVLTIAFIICSFKIEPSKLKFVGLAFIITPCALLTTLFCEIVHGANKIPESNLIKILPSLFTLIFMGILLLMKNLTIIPILFCWALGNIGGMIISISIVFQFAKNKMPNTKCWPSDFPFLKESFKYGFQAWLGQIIGQLNLRFDTFLVAYFLTVKEVGYYSVATTIANFLFFIPGSIAVASLPRFTRTDLNIGGKIACKGIRITLFLNFVILALLFGIGKFIIPLIYGKAFIPAITSCLILLPGFYIFGIAHITTAYFNGAIGKPIINTILAGISLVINVILNLILIPKMGLTGTALACTLSYVISIAIAIIVFTKLSNSSLKDFLLLKKGDLASRYLGI